MIKSDKQLIKNEIKSAIVYTLSTLNIPIKLTTNIFIDNSIKKVNK